MDQLRYCLGIDMGTSSLGWAVVELKSNQDSENQKFVPADVIDLGVRIFDDGRDAQTNEPLAVGRRNARSMRKRRDRMLRRKQYLLHTLQNAGLWPVDKEKQSKLIGQNPYEIRCRALDQKITPFELGRALFHMAQRRGFKSNRKVDKDDSSSNMKQAIGVLESKIATSGARTLGEYLYRLRPDERTVPHKQQPSLRVRTSMKGSKTEYSIYPDRYMYEAELRAIWERQKEFYPNMLTDDLFQKIHRTIIEQRPLAPQEVGVCQFEEGEKRAPKASPYFQRARILQDLNHLELVSGTLSPENREKVKKLLLTKKEVRFDDIRKKLGLPPSAIFNLEANERRKIDGDLVNSFMGNKNAFGEKWDKLTIDQRHEVISLLLAEHEDEALSALLMQNPYNLSEEQAGRVLHLTPRLPNGYGSLSVKALQKIIPFLEEGARYDEACQKAGYHHSYLAVKEFAKLPYYGVVLDKAVIGASKNPKEDPSNPANNLDDTIGNWERYAGKINNPTVHVALNQTRKVVNAIVEKYGRPTQIAVELARDLKMSQKEKLTFTRRQNENTKRNEKIMTELEQLGLPNNYENRMRYKLWEDQARDPQHRVCPFCGKVVSISELFAPVFEIEHLLPFSRTFNDSHTNKVISCTSCNRDKFNKTPFEAFGHDTQRWEKILDRIKDYPFVKQRAFREDSLSDEKEKELIARQLNDTKYMAKMARQYLGCVCEDGNVRPIPGGMTAHLRHAWGLNPMLGDPDDEKERDDHRHHAIDAFVVACTSWGMLKQISILSGKGIKRVHFPPKPFDEFDYSQFQDMLERTVVSHKIDHGGVGTAILTHRTTGALHEETNFGFAKQLDEKYALFSTRKELASLVKDKNIETIANRKIRNNVQRLLAGISDEKVRKARLLNFARKNNIRRVTVCEKRDISTMIAIRDKNTGRPYRYVSGGSNYCTDIYCPNRGPQKGKWCAETISTFDAHRKDFIPAWKKAEPEAKLIMRLFRNDTMAYDEDGKRIIARVKKMSGGNVVLIAHNVASPKEEGRKISANRLKDLNARKIKIDMLGKVLDPYRMGSTQTKE